MRAFRWENLDHNKQINYILAFPKKFLWAMYSQQKQECREKKRKKTGSFRAVSSSSSLFSDIKIYYKEKMTDKNKPTV